MSEADKNQELHHLAALAAGYELEWAPEWPGGGCFMRRVVPEPEEPFSKRVPWRPLEDDGDAFRLAVDLELEIYHGDDYGAPAVFVGYPARNSRFTYVLELSRKDKMAATRRAILRAAAEVGRVGKQHSFSSAKKALLADVVERSMPAVARTPMDASAERRHAEIGLEIMKGNLKK